MPHYGRKTSCAAILRVQLQVCNNLGRESGRNEYGAAPKVTGANSGPSFCPGPLLAPIATRIAGGTFLGRIAAILGQTLATGDHLPHIGCWRPAS